MQTWWGHKVEMALVVTFFQKEFALTPNWEEKAPLSCHWSTVGRLVIADQPSLAPNGCSEFRELPGMGDPGRNVVSMLYLRALSSC